MGAITVVTGFEANSTALACILQTLKMAVKRPVPDCGKMENESSGSIKTKSTKFLAGI
jgi:hypothetical protein